MKNQRILLGVALVLTPSLAWGQAPCKCSPRSASVVLPYFPVEYATYEGEDSCRGCGPQHQPGCYAHRPIGGVPLTLRNMFRTLDCLIPCGPRSGHGCGITCIGAGSGCLRRHCDRDITYCPNCGAKPFSCNCCAGSPIYAPAGPVHQAGQLEPFSASEVLPDARLNSPVPSKNLRPDK